MFGGYGFCPGFGGFGYGRFGGGNLIGMGFMVIFLVVLVAAAVYFFRNLTSRTNATTTNNPNALSILQTRYASGEIDTEEFQRRKQEILK